MGVGSSTSQKRKKWSVKKMDEQKIRQLAAGEGFGPIEQRVFARFVTKRNLDTSPSYLREWTGRFQKQSHMCHMDLASLRAFRDSITEVMEELDGFIK